MTKQPTVWRSTGLHWESGCPVLTAAGRAGEVSRELALGGQVGWALKVSRVCCGIWTGTHRVACPLNSALPDSTESQCRACAPADHGKAIARDAIVDDGRNYSLYLAWFGPGLLKIGLTATERDSDRLLEQGAIAYAMLAAGSYLNIRRAERLAAATGIARERIPSLAKSAAWWDVGTAAGRAAEIASARVRIMASLDWPVGVDIVPGSVIDLARDFGLDQPIPDVYDEVTAIAGGACLTGNILALIGRKILLDNASGPLLVDMRRIAGWPVCSVANTDTTTTRGELTAISRSRPRHDDDLQRTLF